MTFERLLELSGAVPLFVWNHRNEAGQYVIHVENVPTEVLVADSTPGDVGALIPSSGFGCIVGGPIVGLVSRNSTRYRLQHDTFHRRRFKKRLGLMALSTLLILATQVVAVEPKTPPRIHIEAEQMEVQQKTRIIRFTGKVSIREINWCSNARR